MCGSLPEWGTLPSDAVNGLEIWGYRALWFENAPLDRLYALVEQGWPVILFFLASDLPHGTSGLHAVVLTGFAKQEAILMDPIIGDEFRFKLRDFTRAWATLDHQGMVI
ncbi:MAG: C39 family peptidase [Anaerolineales bacterium]|nr:C39 family peptidase [Anaerolineales bacterium]